MSFIIWYQVEIEEENAAGGLLGAAASLIGLGLPLKLSNSVINGAFILDADITITMTGGDSADSFEMTLINLPTKTADLLKQKQNSGMSGPTLTPLTVKIHLGYFDEPSTTTGSQPVLEGKVTSIKSTVGEDGVGRTVIKGQEKGGYRLRTTCIEVGKPQNTTGDALVKEVIAQPAGVSIADEGKLNLPLTDFTLKADNGLQALRILADMAKSPLVVRDNTIYLGAAVGSPKYPAPVAFSPDTNIVRLDELQENDVDAERCPKPTTQEKPPVAIRTRLDLTVLGHPGLRVGQVATVKNLAETPQGTLRIEQVTHRFSTRSGYVCEVKLIVAEAGQRARMTTGVQSAVDRVRDVVESSQSQRPALDMGQIKEYTPGSQQKHLATLDYGQSPPADGVAPSVETLIDSAVQLHNKPIAAPFAFHKCGLIVPIYPKMRALIAHNRGLVNDAVVAGFVWAENPLQERPQNEAGDYWLALPTALDNAGLPTGKGANDLTDSSGRRVIQNKAFQIFVADDKLPDVGVRPTPPDANTLIIEHQSGAKITIDKDGKITIETNSQELTLTNGSVSLNLNGATVEVK